jgi:signal transduction histidine kinase
LPPPGWRAPSRGPILALQEGTAAVGRGDLEVRLVAATGDELGQLARGFNAMTESLAAKDAQIQQYAGNLEARVEERTAELRQANEELVRKERLAVLGQLTATVAHELRNPLGTIRTSFAVVEQQAGDATGAQRRAFDRIERNIGRCDRIITELLDFTRVRELERASTSLDSWLGHFFREYALPPEVVLCHEPLVPDAIVSIDRDQFRRALVNVVDNACQAMRDGDDGASAGGRLTVTTRDAGHRVEIAISDTGSGMPADVMARVFEPLYSTKSFGVGLGLPTVKQIMERHDGGIEFASQEGRGTQAVLWLPHCPNGEGVPS